MASITKLNVIIVGSGLAGLTAARILREHHNVTVYERGEADVATGGQGIMISPHGVKILETIGYDRVRAGAVPIYGFRTYDMQGNMQEEADLDLKPRFGADTLAQKRSDFRDELYRLATTEADGVGIKGDPAKMVFHSAVVDLDPEKGTITLDDGSTATGDLVVVADGIHSRLRSKILGDDTHHVKKTGLTCYRIAISTEDATRAVGDLGLPHWWDPKTCQNRSSIISAADGTSRFITAYPLRNETYFNLSCIVRTEASSKAATESWNADGDRGKMLEAFSDFQESVKLILGAAQEVKVWELQDLDPLPNWVRGRSIVIGDAAHAMTPLQGQGANMSIEDAESLRLLTPGTTRDEVHGILKVAEEFRIKRTSRIIADTRATHANFKVVDKWMQNAEFKFGYNGIQDALKTSREAAFLV